MTIRVEHELHDRRRGRNTGVGLILVGVVGLVFALTVVKVLNLEEIARFERFDHVARPQIDPAVQDAMRAAAEARAAEEASE
jgi:hypothetical protein